MTTTTDLPAATLWEIEKKHRAIARIHECERLVLRPPTDDLIDANR